MTAWVVDHVPLWGWVAGVIIALAVSYPYWAPIWALLPRPVKAALIAISAGAAAYLAGRRAGVESQKDRQAAQSAKAVEKAKEVEDEVRSRSKPDLDKSFDRWVRRDR